MPTVIQADLDRFSDEYRGELMFDLADGLWIPQRPVEVAYALLSLAQGFTRDGLEDCRELLRLFASS